MADSPILITPSILAADFSKLQEEVDSVADSADWLQVDVMDGHFVPNLSFGAPVLKCIQTDLPHDVHLMVSNPADRIDEFLALNVANITFHAEAVKDTDDQKELIKRIKDGGATAGIAINPESSVDSIGNVLPDIDLLLCMTVHPGFGGQEFIDHVLGPMTSIRQAYPDLMIQVDGGVNDQTAARCIEAGANNLVSGSFIFGSDDRILAINSLRNPS